MDRMVFMQYDGRVPSGRAPVFEARPGWVFLDLGDDRHIALKLEDGVLSVRSSTTRMCVRPVVANTIEVELEVD